MYYLIGVHKANSQQHLQDPIGHKRFIEVFLHLLALLNMPSEVLLCITILLHPQYSMMMTS